MRRRGRKSDGSVAAPAGEAREAVDTVEAPVDDRAGEVETAPASEPLVEDADRRDAGEHAPGALDVPPGYATFAGEPNGGGRSVGVVVSRFNGEFTSRLLDGALAELAERGVAREAVVIMQVPGAFELPLAAMALAKTRRHACVVALGCVIRGETPHFDLVAGEAASGLQLAALETGVPVSFGVLTCETRQQAEARIARAGDAVRSALEMADVFVRLRATSSASSA